MFVHYCNLNVNLTYTGSPYKPCNLEFEFNTGIPNEGRKIIDWTELKEQESPKKKTDPTQEKEDRNNVWRMHLNPKPFAAWRFFSFISFFYGRICWKRRRRRWKKWDTGCAPQAIRRRLHRHRHRDPPDRNWYPLLKALTPFDCTRDAFPSMGKRKK